ncbi:MAG: transglycosylase SLT domain-containing protein [Myxococcota bacterium]|nr:transglycosylase SLT domain-containing protein [Myxococcota bacterium]
MLLHQIFISLSLASSQGSVEDAKRALLKGDHETTISIIRSILAQKKLRGSEKDVARYLIANAYERRGDALLAADQYRSIYWGGRSLSKRSLYRQANARFNGGDYKGAISGCQKFRQKWPKSELAEDCLLIMGSSNGYLGKLDNVRYYYQTYLDANPQSPKAESLWAQASLFSYQHGQKGAKDELRYFYFNHTYPTTAQQIEMVLSTEDLSPRSLAEKGARIWSLIRSGSLEEAWTKTEELGVEAETSLEAQQWLDNNMDSITWMTRRYEEYIDRKKLAYTKEPTGTLAWKIFRAYTRAGEWEEATTWGMEMLQTYKGRGRWAGAKDDVARAFMFQRRYTEAAELWGKQHSKLAKFNYAFCHYMNGDYEDAISFFETLSLRNDGWGVAANYWIGRSKEKLVLDPKENYDYVVQNDDTNWYRLLLAQRELLDLNGLHLHNGQWAGVLPKDVLLAALPQNLKTTDQPHIHRQKKLRRDNDIQWQNFSLSPQQSHIASSTKPSPPQTGFIDQKWETFIGTLPNSYQSELLGTEAELEEAFQEFYQQNSQHFPELKEIYYLAKAGDYPIAAYKLNAIYDQWTQAIEARNPNEAQKSALGLVSDSFQWLTYMLFVRSHHHVMRYTQKLDRHLETEEQKKESQQLNYPIVYSHHLWSIAQKYNLDPLLMHSILRAESTYREFIVSWAGAIGYVQVMPKTGAKVANLLGEQSYSPKDLEDPKINLQYGSYYFSQLMLRFDQAYPFAVGSYNGGPHNMSRWYKNLKGNIEMDEFVEHIPYNETRLYIKKVCGYYAQYVSLFGEQDSSVYIPTPPEKDDSSVIDF